MGFIVLNQLDLCISIDVLVAVIECDDSSEDRLLYDACLLRAGLLEQVEDLEVLSDL